MGKRAFGLLKTAALSLVLSAATYASASAVIINWNPSGAGISTTGTFQAAGFGIHDFASIIFPNNPAPVGSINETGFLVVDSFSFGGATVGNVNTVGLAGWGLVEEFTATSHGAGTAASFTGAFDSITATVFGFKTTHKLPSVTFTAGMPELHLPPGVNCKTFTNCVELATESGPIRGSANFADITGGVPNANVDTLFTPNLAEAAFFVKPNALTKLDLDQAFTNETGAINTHKCSAPCSVIVQIGGTGFPGGGDGSFIPEPASVMLFGVGLFTLGLVRRRRR